MLTDLHALEAILAPLGWRKKSWGPGLWRPRDGGKRSEFISPASTPGSGLFEWYAVWLPGSYVGTLDELAEYVKSKEGTP